ncbi:MAG: hypothetical protein HC899_23370, partial [Leptolyngbyaceae cyanobacterium SM1_4_3]|nr:hypothetical protein [Leptolyngbyaceae cyanobacterium SM1_4_3]
ARCRLHDACRPSGGWSAASGQLQRSFAEVVRRHEILRTSFPLVNGNPVQAIAPQLELTIPLVDLRGLPAAQQAAESQRQIAAITQLSFDLAQFPLFHISVLQTDAEQILLVNLHHIIADGWSIDILLREVATLYHAFLLGQLASLPELPIQYADFALWQRQALQQAPYDSQLNYWQTQLAEPLPVLHLPTDYPRPAVQRFRGKAIAPSPPIPGCRSESLQPTDRSDPVHGAFGSIQGIAASLHRTNRHPGGHPDRQPQPDRVGGTDRLFCEYAGASHRPIRQSYL